LLPYSSRAWLGLNKLVLLAQARLEESAKGVAELSRQMIRLQARPR
jgi:hypothetical protein